MCMFLCNLFYGFFYRDCTSGSVPSLGGGKITEHEISIMCILLVQLVWAVGGEQFFWQRPI